MVEYGPVKVIDLNITADGQFSFKKAAEEREKAVMEAMVSFFDRRSRKLTPEEEIRTRLKYGIIYEGDIRRIVYVDNQTMKAYRMINNDYYMGGLEKPLNEIADFRFERWCTGMDL